MSARDHDLEAKLKVNSAIWITVGVMGWAVPGIMRGFGWIADLHACWVVAVVTVVALIGCYLGRKAAYRH